MLFHLRRTFALFGLAALALTASATAQVATPISKVPFTIKRAGSYVLKRDLTFTPSTGTAITIAVDDVTVDLGGHVLANTAGAATTAWGISADGRSSITVRNGTIRGFHRGIYLNKAGETESRRHLVTGVSVDRCTAIGIFLGGPSCTVRDCTVTETGGTEVQGVSQSYGILIEGNEATIVGNDVLDTTPNKTDGRAIQVDSGDGALIENNRVRNRTGSVDVTGILIGNFGQNFAINNRVANCSTGIFFNGSVTGKYRDNIVLGCTNPYSGGTAAGNQ